ncbi:MAG TPA: VOC family protein [Solirubrobacteraceae bacterium]|jgi:catechol 2,3-dioxygenase-like lactoylglutathione lyase family enzyme|nr:VOC family protein [Solirubrobacteraceae bacterium]
MFDHVSIRTRDLAASRGLFATVLAVLEIEPTSDGESLVIWHDFVLAGASEQRPPTSGAHIAFAAPSREHVDAFWQAGLDAGMRDDGAPGDRSQYGAGYYGAFLLDPGGNSIEAVHRAELRKGPGVIDHVWLRVSDLVAASDFYRRAGEAAGFAAIYHDADRTTFTNDESEGSFSLVRGTATANLHIAFPGDEQAVQRFHESALAAGYRSNGEPGERVQYHAGYYAAFVLDPDGNNIEVVEHHRS